MFALNYIGFSGNDTVEGLGGNDSLNGNTQNDLLMGGDGNDSITGLDGNDTLLGGAGNDTMSGGVGDDTYLINRDDGNDTITDTSGNNVIQFGAGITRDDVWAFKNLALHVRNSNGTDSTTGLTGNFTEFHFADGSVLNYHELANENMPFRVAALCGNMRI